MTVLSLANSLLLEVKNPYQKICNGSMQSLLNYSYSLNLNRLNLVKFLNKFFTLVLPISLWLSSLVCTVLPLFYLSISKLCCPLWTCTVEPKHLCWPGPATGLVTDHGVKWQSFLVISHIWPSKTILLPPSKIPSPNFHLSPFYTPNFHRFVY